MAFQTSSSVSLIKCENNNKLNIYSQIEIKDQCVLRQTIGHFEFLTSAQENMDSYSKEMLLGYRNGLILQINYLDNSIINKFNIVNYEEGEKFVAVQTILLNPKDSLSFYVLYSNSVLMKYLLEKTEENQSFLEEKSRIVDKKKQSNKTKAKISNRDENNNFEIKPYKFAGFPELNFISGKNYDKEAKNPTNFIFFSCNAISEAGISQNQYFYNTFGANIIFTYVGYDGFLRIFDLELEKPIFSFKSNFGGINHFSYNSTGDIIALAGHDDNIVLLDFDSYSYVALEGHRSFISKVILQDICPNYIRVFGSSMDGNVSITDINLQDVGFQRKSSINSNKSQKDKNKLPIKVIFNDFEAKRHQVKNLNLGNADGVGSIIFHEPHLISSGFDGSVSIWGLEFEKEKKKDEKENDESESVENNIKSKDGGYEERKADIKYYKTPSKTPTKDGVNNSDQQYSKKKT